MTIQSNSYQELKHQSVEKPLTNQFKIQMKNPIIATILLLSSITASMPAIAKEPVISRTVSSRLLKLGNGSSQCPSNEYVSLDQDAEINPPPYCYKFVAVVDIDSGHLNAWATDKKGNSYVVGRLHRGDRLYIRQVFKYKGRWMGQISYLRDGCEVLSCSAGVDLRYLR